MKKLGQKKIGLIGVGNMGTSILEGALGKRIISPSQVWVYDKDKKKSSGFSRRTGVRVANGPKELCQRSDLILLAMKPQDFAGFAGESKKYFRKNSCVVSILAGLTTRKIGQTLGIKTVVRAMPNLGAKVGESMTVITGDPKRSLHLAEKIFKGCGEVTVLPEKMFDLVTAISGSGPAYFFHLMELLADFGVKQGIRPSVAARLAIQTGLGAVLLAKSAGISCAGLRKMVTSKKGTTEAAFKTLRRKNFAKIFHLGLHAAARRSRQLRNHKTG